MGPQPSHAPVAARAANHLELAGGIIGHPADDRRDFLPALSPQAADQIRADGLVQRRVVAVMPMPDPTYRGIDRFVDARD